MNASIDAKMGRDMVTHWMALRMARRIWMEWISRFRISLRRSRKLLSQPKNLTNLTPCRISWVRETRWSVSLLMLFLLLISILMEYVSNGIPITSNAYPDRAL